MLHRAPQPKQRAPLKIRAHQAQIDRPVERARVARQVARDLASDARGGLRVFDHVEALAQRRHRIRRFGHVEELHREQAARAFGDEQAADRRVDCADPHQRTADAVDRAPKARMGRAQGRVDRRVNRRAGIAQRSVVVEHLAKVELERLVHGPRFPLHHCVALSFFSAWYTLARALSGEQSSAAPISSYSSPANLRITSA